MAADESVVLDAADGEDAKKQQREGAEPIAVRAPGLPKLPPLTVEQAHELWEELSQILAHQQGQQLPAACATAPGSCVHEVL